MGCAVAPAGFVAIKLLAQDIAVLVSDERTKRLFSGLTGLARDVECLTKQAFIICALWGKSSKTAKKYALNDPQTLVGSFVQLPLRECYRSRLRSAIPLLPCRAGLSSTPGSVRPKLSARYLPMKRRNSMPISGRISSSILGHAETESVQGV